MTINDQLCISFDCQVLEYHPQPWNQWLQVGDLLQARRGHATLTIGPEQLPCLLSGESFNIKMVIIESRILMINKEVLKMTMISSLGFHSLVVISDIFQSGFYSLALVSDSIQSSNHNNWRCHPF